MRDTPICVDMRYDSEEYIHVDKPLSAVRRIYDVTISLRYDVTVCRHYSEQTGSMSFTSSTTYDGYMAYTDTSGGHLRRDRRGARSEFFGFNYNIALTDITGIFRGIFNEMARAHRSRSNIHRRDYL